MARYVALLRGVNVGGVKVAMGDLRRLFDDLGHTDVTTYIQSGNVAFSSSTRDAARVAAEVEARIAAELGLATAVIVRSSAQLAAIVAGNPYRARRVEPSKLHVAFLVEAPSAEAVSRLAVPDGEPEEFAVRGTELFVHYPNGLGRAKFNGAFIERRLGIAATMRNWNTVTKLLELVS